MRILHVMASRANGGAETYCADMLASLKTAGIDQVAVIPRTSSHHARLVERGRADFKKGFTREAVTQRMIALYSEITAERSAVLGATGREERA